MAILIGYHNPIAVSMGDIDMMITQEFGKVLTATYYFINVSPKGSKISEVLGFTVEELNKMVTSGEWRQGLKFWGYSDLDAKPGGYGDSDWQKRRKKGKGKNWKKNQKNDRKWDGVSSDMKKMIKAELYDQDNRCSGCRQHFTPRHLTLDHIIPHAKGGTNDPDNFQLLCHACNVDKGSMSMGRFIALLVEREVLSA